MCSAIPQSNPATGGDQQECGRVRSAAARVHGVFARALRLSIHLTGEWGRRLAIGETQRMGMAVGAVSLCRDEKGT